MSLKLNKYIIITIALIIIAVAFVIVVLTGLNNEENITIPKNEHYYDIETAKKVIKEYGYDIGSDIKIESQDGTFYYKVNIVPQKYDFLNITGTLEFTAQYSSELEEWKTNIIPNVDYEWKLSGRWYAETQNYVKSILSSYL